MNLISDKNLQELIEKKRILQARLSDLLNTNYTKDDINALTSEIRYIDDKIGKMVGRNEQERLEHIKNRKSGRTEINIRRFNELNNKIRKISQMNVATKRFLNVIDHINNFKYEQQYTDVLAKVKI